MDEGPCNHHMITVANGLQLRLIAVSEPPLKLQSDVHFWLQESQGKMYIDFTLTVDFQNPRIVIEKWELVDDQEHRTQQVTVFFLVTC